jgi:hypothetical protein
MAVVSAHEMVRLAVARNGYGVVDGCDLTFSGLEDSWQELAASWDRLQIDEYMKDVERYRLRRYGRFFFVPATSELVRLPHALVFQSRYVNNFVGGIHRNFAPLEESTFTNPYLLALIRFDFSCFEVDDPAALSQPWEVWIHQIRIRAFGGKSVAPAPEGVHHDGHDFIAMHLVARCNVTGGTSVLYDNAAVALHSCLLEQPLDTIYANDHRVMHGVGAVGRGAANGPSHRDMLIIDFDHKPDLRRGAD